MKTISVIIPVYNEEAVIGTLLEFLLPLLKKELQNFEVIVVNDGSTDATEKILKKYSVRLVSLKENYGQEAAILAGAKVATGEGVIVMDGDFQDPPQLIPFLIRKWEQGYELVFAKRTKRNDFWKYFSYIYYRLLNFIYPKIAKDCGNFFICSSNLIKGADTMFLRGYLATKAKKVGYVTFERGNRSAGETSYTFLKRLKLAFRGFLLFRELK